MLGLILILVSVGASAQEAGPPPPTPIPDSQSTGESGSEAPTEETAPEAEGKNEIPEEPKNQFNLNAYPDTAKHKRLSWAVGFFSWGQNNEANASNSVLSVTTRITWLPVYRDGGEKLLHIGGSFSTRDPNGNNQYRSRPEARFVDFLVDTGSFATSRIQLYGLELVGVHGPLPVPGWR